MFHYVSLCGGVVEGLDGDLRGEPLAALGGFRHPERGGTSPFAGCLGERRPENVSPCLDVFSLNETTTSTEAEYTAEDLTHGWSRSRICFARVL